MPSQYPETIAGTGLIPFLFSAHVWGFGGLDSPVFDASPTQNAR